MSVLPQVPTDLEARSREYLVELVRQIERELRRRPGKQMDGAFYVSGDLPLRMISPNGTIYEIAVDNTGALVTTVVTL